MVFGGPRPGSGIAAPTSCLQGGFQGATLETCVDLPSRRELLARQNLGHATRAYFT
jgi:hypothetical protein